MIAALWTAAALALAPPAPPEPALRVMLRGQTERWNDPSIAAIYGSGAWQGAVGLVIPVWGPLSVDLEGGFARKRGSGSKLELTPLSGLVEATAPFGVVEGFVGLGPTWTAFTETGGTQRVVSGARVAGEIRLGLRADTSLVIPPAPPARGGPIRRVDVEFYVARRSEWPKKDDSGFQLGAWRASVGLGLAF
jgi:hypothetical protein